MSVGPLRAGGLSQASGQNRGWPGVGLAERRLTDQADLLSIEAGGQDGASAVLAFDPVFQNTDLLDLEFDRIAVFEKPAELKAAAVADGPGADEFTRHQCFVLRDMRDNFLEGEQ